MSGTFCLIGGTHKMLDILVDDDVETWLQGELLRPKSLAFVSLISFSIKMLASLSTSWLSLSFDVEGMAVLKWGIRGTNYSKPQVASYLVNFFSLLNLATGWY